MEIIEERRRSREKIIGRVSSWVRELPFKVTAIVVGSYARGDFNLWSDVDVLLISRDFKGSPLDRLMEIDVPPGFQVIPLTLPLTLKNTGGKPKEGTPSSWRQRKKGWW
ncbi:MAG: nucleotidyltransferase domain-containing protein [Candidatus Freyarchaeota archaeon]